MVVPFGHWQLAGNYGAASAVAVFNNFELRNFVIDVRKKYDQVIDHITAGSEIGRMAITCDRLDEQDVRTRFPNVPVIVKPWEYGELASICLSLLGPTIEATPA